MSYNPMPERYVFETDGGSYPNVCHLPLPDLLEEIREEFEITERERAECHPEFDVTLNGDVITVATRCRFAEKAKKHAEHFYATLASFNRIHHIPLHGKHYHFYAVVDILGPDGELLHRYHGTAISPDDAYYAHEWQR
ncbi:hypothetical protein M8C13_06165 [Crossiella sp. SN42]|uniref:hypothetical protein n=1 Tax=Crossiella sp. SN42 TaxID=2944808 RepID=UPI00207D7060|nr:hypothetical protein [Crossiella sp. SN42]MCO1575344.1 hypothetical protein [Crossiella sp. SN42]